MFDFTKKLNLSRRPLIMPNMNNNNISPLIKIAAVIVIIAGLIASKAVVLPILLAFFISIICTQPVLWLEKKRVPYSLAIIMVLVSMAMLIIFFGGIIGNSLASFKNDALGYEDTLKQNVFLFIDNLNKAGADINTQQLTDLLDPGKILNFTAAAIGEIGGVLSNSLVIVLITIFMLLEGKSFALKALVIEKQNGNSLKYFDIIGQNIRNYLSIKTVISFITGLLIWICLLIIGVDYAILWGLVAFLLNFIPNIGSLFAALPTMLLALVQLGVGGMVWTGVAYLVVNVVMGTIIEPKVMGIGMGLSTLVVFLSLIVWGFIFGIVGMFLAIPLTMAIKIMLEQNSRLKWISVLLGTEKETREILEQN